METGVIGGNKDQAKMAGTPGQKASAIRQGIQEADDLATAVRRGQGRTAASGEEKAKLEKAGALEGLGELEGRVQQLAEQQAQQAFGQREDIQLQQLSEDPETQDLLARIQANPDDFEAVSLLNKKMGAEQPMTAQELMGKFSSAEQLAGQAAAEGLQNMTAGAVDYSTLGFESPDKVAELLEMDPAEFAQMTVPELTQKLNSMLQSEYGQVDALQAQLADPNLGPAERAEVRKQLRDMGAVGIRKAESTAEELEDKIANADTVTMFGEEVAVKDIMDDAYMKGVVSNYFLMDEATRAEFDEANPEMADFINHFENELKEATADIDTGVKALAAEKTKDDTFQTATGFDDNLMNDLTGGEWSNPDRAASVMGQLEQEYPVVKLIGKDSTLSPEQQVNLKAGIDKVKELAPDFVKEMMGMEEWQLKKLGLLDLSSSDTQDLLSIIDQDRVIVKVDPLRPETIMNAFDPKLTEEDLNDFVQSAKAAINLGELSPAALNAIPGLKEMDMPKIAAWIQTQVPGSLAEAGKMKSLSSYLDEIKTSASKLDNVQLPATIKNRFAARSAVSAADIGTALERTDLPGAEQTVEFMNSNPEKFTESGRAEVTGRYQGKVMQDMEQQITTTGLPSINDLLSGIKNDTIADEDIESVLGVLSGNKVGPSQKVDIIAETMGNIEKARKVRDNKRNIAASPAPITKVPAADEITAIGGTALPTEADGSAIDWANATQIEGPASVDTSGTPITPGGLANFMPAAAPKRQIKKPEGGIASVLEKKRRAEGGIGK
jgi:hypothetical protein